jgi:hypothetical protein
MLRIFLGYILITAHALHGCGETVTDEQTLSEDAADALVTHQIEPGDTFVSDYGTFFIVVVDTNDSYEVLQQKMFNLNRQLNLPIDTMGRLFNKEKNLIALPDTSSDEMYAGDYYPRRFPSEHLSLEYLHYYRNQSAEKTIALVAGIYEAEKNADSALAILKRTESGCFKLKAEVYIGCMH